MAQIFNFKENTENTEKMINEINTNIAFFAKRAKTQDHKIANLHQVVNDHATIFSNKIDRLVKDVAHRFKNFT